MGTPVMVNSDLACGTVCFLNLNCFGFNLDINGTCTLLGKSDDPSATMQYVPDSGFTYGEYLP